MADLGKGAGNLPDGFGFLRAPDYNYLPGPDDIYISPSQIRDSTFERVTRSRVRFDPERYERYLQFEGGTRHYEDPEVGRDKILFDNLTPLSQRKSFRGSQ